LNLAGRDKGGYYHELFLRSKQFLALRIQRVKIKGNGARKPSSPETEPRFYKAPYLPSTKSETPTRINEVSSAGNMLALGPSVNRDAGESVSLQELLASLALVAYIQRPQQQLLEYAQLAPPLFRSSAALVGDIQEVQDRLRMANLVHQEIDTFSRREHDAANTAMMLALASTQQYPAAYAGWSFF
jgi:hypothetical protein